MKMHSAARVTAVLLLACTAAGHVGSPDVFFEGNAGPYPVFVAIRPPVVIPGVAEIEIRTPAAGVSAIRITPLPLTGDAAKFAPAADTADRSKQDPQFFTGSLWMMRSGAWQVRIEVDGPRGSGRLAVPVPAAAVRTTEMQFAMGSVLFALMLILAVGLVSIVGASIREGQLEPGKDATAGSRRRARVFMALTAALVAAVLYFGNSWWSAEANAYSRYVYKPLRMEASVEDAARLVLNLSDPGWLNFRKIDDFIPDHNHLMHMYLIRLPEMEAAWHLHPEMTESGRFVQHLPALPAGRYQIYGDVVHRNGFPETLTAEFETQAVAGAPLTGDDSAGSGPPLSGAKFERTEAPLSGGYRMVWLREKAVFKVREANFFRFRIEDAEGRPATDLELYMGMPGHAAFLKHDGGVFAHVHPSGSVPMASLGLTEEARQADESAEKKTADPHAGHAMHAAALPAVVSFPYGFPRAGEYRIFVQVKRAGKVQMGVFDARAE